MKWKSQLYLTLYSPCNSPGLNTGVGSLSPGDLPNPGTEPRSPTLQADSLPAEPPGKPNAEYIMWNVKIAGRNSNNLRYADDITLMAESEEELKSLLMKGKEEFEKTGLKFNIQKMNIVACGLITSWQIDEETMTNYFLGIQNHCRWWWQPWI